jgi:hypothetical protein
MIAQVHEYLLSFACYCVTDPVFRNLFISFCTPMRDT